MAAALSAGTATKPAASMGPIFTVTEAVKTTGGTHGHREKKEPYQNVTLAKQQPPSTGGQAEPASTASLKDQQPPAAASNSLFELRDKKASTESPHLVKYEEQLPMKRISKASLGLQYLSGGHVTEMMASSVLIANNPIYTAGSNTMEVQNFLNTRGSSPSIFMQEIHVHHHHHFIDPHLMQQVPVSGGSRLATGRNSNIGSSHAGSNPHFYANLMAQQHYLSPSNNRCENQVLREEAQLAQNKDLLRQSGWYFGTQSSQQSTELLKETPEGTFLVRDSADSRFHFSLSVQRSQEDGPTSVRIYFGQGKFRLDAEENIVHKMPTFDSVLNLVFYYCQINQKSCKSAKKSHQQSHVWIDVNAGELYSPICMKQPLRKEVPSLAHSARLAVHRSLKSQARIHELKLPKKITQYLREYPHVL